MPPPPVIELRQGYRCMSHGKLSYMTEEEALAELERIKDDPKTAKIPQRAYHHIDEGDRRCIYWHLTSRPHPRRHR